MIKIIGTSKVILKLSISSLFILLTCRKMSKIINLEKQLDNYFNLVSEMPRYWCQLNFFLFDILDFMY